MTLKKGKVFFGSFGGVKPANVKSGGTIDVHKISPRTAKLLTRGPDLLRRRAALRWLDKIARV